MDATLKITAGPEAGQLFACTTPETIVGRSPRCAIRLSSASISYEHAMISRIADDYFIENLSANGTYLNNDRITTKTRLRAKDQLRVGDETVLRVESVPASGRAGSSRTTLLAVFVVLLVVTLIVVVADPFGGGGSSGMGRAYVTLLEFTQKETAAGHLPMEMPGLLQEAWRLETANNADAARKAWLRVSTTLDSTEKSNHYQENSRVFPRALDNLRNPDGHSVTEEETGAALSEFVQLMGRK